MPLHPLLNAPHPKSTFTSSDLASAAKRVGFRPPTPPLRSAADAYFSLVASQNYTVEQLESALFLLSLPSRSHYPHANVASSLYACLVDHNIISSLQ